MTKSANVKRPRDELIELARNAQCSLTSIGDFERLAGINTENPAERKAFWDSFQHLYVQPTQVLFDAVVDHCSEIAIKRIYAGELSLIPTLY